MPVIAADLKGLPSTAGLPTTAELRKCDVSLPVNNKHLLDFLLFCYKRHDAWIQRRAGVPRGESSDDPIISLRKGGNVVRELDDGTMFVAKHILPKGSQDIDEVFFRVALYSIFSASIPTYQRWAEKLGHPPDLKSFENLATYDEILLDYKAENPKAKIYSGHAQNVPPVQLFGIKKLTALNHLRLLKVMTNVKLGSHLSKLEYLEDASILLGTIPTQGPFLGLAMLLNLAQSTKFSWKESGFATLGPGAVNTCRYVFGEGVGLYGQSADLQLAALRWIRDHQSIYWERLGISRQDEPRAPPELTNFRWDETGMAAPHSKGGKALRVLDLENAGCHFVYYRSWRQKAKYAFEEGQTVGCHKLKEWMKDEKDLDEDEERQIADNIAMKTEEEEEEDELARGGEQDSSQELETASASAGDEDVKPVVPVPVIDEVITIKSDEEEAKAASQSALTAAALSAAGLSSGESSTVNSQSNDDSQYMTPQSNASSPLTSRASTPSYVEEEYEVEKIVCHRGSSSTVKSRLYRVRWKGWNPEWDEWQRGGELIDSAGEAIEEYEEWLRLVQKEIGKMQEEAKKARKRLGDWKSSVGGSSRGKRAGKRKAEEVEGEEEEGEVKEQEEEEEVDELELREPSVVGPSSSQARRVSAGKRRAQEIGEEGIQQPAERQVRQPSVIVIEDTPEPETIIEDTSSSRSRPIRKPARFSA